MRGTYLSSWLHRIPTKESASDDVRVRYSRTQGSKAPHVRELTEVAGKDLPGSDTGVINTDYATVTVMKEIRPDQHTAEDNSVKGRRKNEWNPSKFINGPNAVFENEHTVIEIKIGVENYRVKAQQGISTYHSLTVGGRRVAEVAHLRGKWAQAPPGKQADHHPGAARPRPPGVTTWHSERKDGA